MKKPALFLIVKIGTVLSGMLAIGILTAQKVLEWWITRQFADNISGEAGSIGIIGGADGPTSIFISTAHSCGNPYIWAGVFAAFSLFGFIALLLMKKQRKS